MNVLDEQQWILQLIAVTYAGMLLISLSTWQSGMVDTSQSNMSPT
jgi:hypothetical protein